MTLYQQQNEVAFNESVERFSEFLNTLYVQNKTTQAFFSFLWKGIASLNIVKSIQIAWRYVLKFSNKKKLRIEQALKVTCNNLIKKNAKSSKKNKQVLTKLANFDSAKCKITAAKCYLNSKLTYMIILKKWLDQNKKKAKASTLNSNDPKKQYVNNTNIGKKPVFEYLPNEDQLVNIVLKAVDAFNI